MTAQTADKLRNNHPRVDFADLSLFGLTRSDPACANRWSGVLGDVFDYPCPPRGQIESHSTSCVRGYVASHVLNGDGTLSLSHYEYMVYRFETIDGRDSLSIDIEEDRIDQCVRGDFWMIMRLEFYSDPTTYVPFRNGQIVEDQSQWQVLS